MDITGWTAMTGIATAVLAAIGVAAAIVATLQLKAAKAVLREEHRAYVYGEFVLRAHTWFEFRLANAGRAPARDVKVSWCPDPTSAARPDLSSESRLTDAKLLAPGDDRLTPFDRTDVRHDRGGDFPSVYSVTISYADRFDTYEETFELTTDFGRQRLSL